MTLRLTRLLPAAILLAGAVAASAVSAGATAPAGAWTSTPVPVAKGDITAITAKSDQEAWATGYRLTSLTQVEHVMLRWDGQRWAQHSQIPGQVFAQALAVRSADDIWVTGGGTAHWDGTSWTARPLAGNVVPDAIATAPGGQAWVAGRVVPGSIKDGLPAIQLWNGTAWQPQTLPDVGKGELTSLSVVSANDVWAAGSVFGPAQTPLLLHWDGTSWQRVETPTVRGKHTWLGGITAFAPNDVWAVGGSASAVGDQPFAVHWNGRKWTEVRTPQVLDGRLRAIGRTTDGTLWTVGGKGAVSVALRWHNGYWQQVQSPNLVVRGFAAEPGTAALWTVGVAKQGDLVPAISRYHR